ncbi:MAG: PAS domain S-box protein [Gemmatimonadaceae bacterium]
MKNQINEAVRLDALAKYAIMDTPPEDAFDDLTRIAARFCHAPIALVSLLDDERQWFKSRVGVTASESPRKTSFCTHALNAPDLFIVPDSELDARFAGGKVFPDGPPIRFYAGAPLLTPEGDALGTLCIMDYEPRELHADHRDVLRVLGRQVMSQLNLRRRNSELAARERLLFTVLESEPECVFMLGSAREVRMMNRAGLTLLEVSELSGVLGCRFEDFVVPEDCARLDEIITRVLAGESCQLSFGLRTATGEQRSIRLNAAPLKNERGEVLEVLGIAHDVTDRVSSDEERHELMLMIERMPEFIATADLEGRIAFMNSSGRRMIGFSETGDVSELHFADYVPDSWLKFFQETVLPTALKEGSWEGEMQLKHLVTDDVIEVIRTIFLVRDGAGEPKFFGSILRDITARKKAENAWRASEERYRTLFEYAPDGLVIANPEGTYIDGNASICRMLGYTRAEFIGKLPSDIVSESEIGHIAPALQTLETKNEYQREWRLRRKDSTLFDAEVIATVMPDGNILGMIRDVTERKRIEDRFRRLVDSNAQGVMFWNSLGQISGANDAFLGIIGYTREDLESGNINWQLMTPPEYDELDRRALAQIAATGNCTPFEKEYIRKDGTRVPVLIGAARFQDSAEEGVSFILDLTERKKLEQQFLRAQRMESIGTLAGGIAHDLNNVLSPIVMAIDLMRMKFPDPDSAELLNIISSTALRGADMVRQVLSFARGVEGRRMEVQMRHLVRDIERIVSETFPKNITVRTSVADDLWTLIGEPTQLHQVLMNLCVNARDAMPRGGTLTISVANYMLDAQYIAMTPGAKAGPYILLQVEDTGVGIDGDTIERIFDPFFTTKEVGKGTGLGLSTSMAIVQSHGGLLQAYSEPNRGAKFKVYLPAQNVRSAELAIATEALLPRGHGELILVVDDELSVRQITQQTLEAFGYRVVLAADGAEAVAIYAAQREKISAVLTDMMMPIMDGPATIQVLRKLEPTLRIIAASGLSISGQSAQAANLGIKHFLAKPYSADALLTALQRILTDAQ